jgi:hypothetical protein
MAKAKIAKETTHCFHFVAQPDMEGLTIHWTATCCYYNRNTHVGVRRAPDHGGFSRQFVPSVADPAVTAEECPMRYNTAEYAEREDEERTLRNRSQITESSQPDPLKDITL